MRLAVKSGIFIDSARVASDEETTQIDNPSFSEKFESLLRTGYPILPAFWGWAAGNRPIPAGPQSLTRCASLTRVSTSRNWATQTSSKNFPTACDRATRCRVDVRKQAQLLQTRRGPRFACARLSRPCRDLVPAPRQRPNTTPPRRSRPSPSCLPWRSCGGLAQVLHVFHSGLGGGLAEIPLRQSAPVSRLAQSAGDAGAAGRAPHLVHLPAATNQLERALAQFAVHRRRLYRPVFP